MARVEVPVTDLTPPKASLTTALTGTNNDLVYTARSGGPGGNSIRVQYIDPGGTTALSVAVQGYDILVTLATTAAVITSTATQVKTAVDRAASHLVTIANASSDDGSGVVTALALTPLSGGSLQKTPPTQTDGDATNDHYFTSNDGLVFLEVVSSDGGPQTVEIEYAPNYASLVDIAPTSESVPAGGTRLLGPFSPTAFNQNSDGDVYFAPSVSTTLKFRAYKAIKAV